MAKKKGDEEEGDDEEETNKVKRGKSRSKSGSKDSEKGSSKKKKPRKSKAAAYSRNSAEHKAIFGDVMDDLYPDWNEKLRKTARLASVKLEGKDFLDADGEVVDSFISALKKFITKRPKKK